MCGIFGYVGKSDNAGELVLEGLKILEYRGYDSWGVAVIEDGNFKVSKKIGKIGSAKLSLPKSNFALGHTRWATHGRVTNENAHPHLSCNSAIALIHNGIVENYQELAKKLSMNHKINSATDTEIIAHLVEEEYGKHNLKEALAKVFAYLHGLNAVAVASSTGEVAVAKNGSPLVLGVGKDEFFLASDATALLPHTKKVIFLEDNQLATLDKNGIKIFEIKTGREIKLQVKELDWKVSDGGLGKHPHFMIKEIYEQPKVLANIATNMLPEAKELASLIQNSKSTFLIASGTAYHACLASTYLFSKIAGYQVDTAVASEFDYLQNFLNKGSLLIAMSQSGETIDVIEPLNAAKKKGVKIAAVVNSLGSTIYRMSDFKVLLGAGPEKAVASTKAYIAKIAFMLLTIYALTGHEKKAREQIKKASAEIERLLETENIDKFKEIVKILVSAEHVYVIGRGVSYPSALEAALKMKEVSYVHTEGLAGGELKHGTIALIEMGTPCIVFAPNDETYQSIISNATEISSRGGLIIGIGPINSSVFDHWIEVKDIGEASIIPNMIPSQLFGYYMALEKGFDPDKPRNLAKAVTVK